jgi:hydrogenase maturation factor
MNLITGEVVDIYVDGWKTMGRVRISGALMHVPMMFLPDAKVGDRILIDSGVAIAKVESRQSEEQKECA